MKFQINVVIPRVENVKAFENITDDFIIFPVLWVDQHFKLNDDIKQKLSIVHYINVAIKNILGPLLVVLGTVILLLLITCLGCENFAAGPQGFHNMEMSETITNAYN